MTKSFENILPEKLTEISEMASSILRKVLYRLILDAIREYYSEKYTVEQLNELKINPNEVYRLIFDSVDILNIHSINDYCSMFNCEEKVLEILKERKFAIEKTFENRIKAIEN